jgi:hypothetical protein
MIINKQLFVGKSNQPIITLKIGGLMDTFGSIFTAETAKGSAWWG